MQASDKVIFLCQSDLWRKILLSASRVIKLFMLQSADNEDILRSVVFKAFSLSVEGKELKTLSVLMQVNPSFLISVESDFVKTGFL